MPVSTRKHYPIQTMNRSHFAFTPHAPRAQGFSLVEMAMVLLVVGLLAALFLPATNTMMDNNRRKETRTKLEALESAITRFVMTTGRLPCPADGSLAPGNINQGLELAAGGACTADALTKGVVPWRTLAVSQSEVLDAWGNLVTYRVWGGAGVTNSLTVANGMNMSALKPAPPPGTPVADTVSGWLTSRGFRACNAPLCALGSGVELASKANGNGVAYFLISHGANKYGAYNPNGTWVGTANGPGPGVQESINRNNQAIRSSPSDDFYIDADLNENTSTAYYDDIVLRPTVIKVALDAGFGPRP